MALDLKKWMSGSPVSVHTVEYCFKFDFCKTTNAPFFTVNMSSLKGTLRNYCDSLPEIHVIIYIFFPRSIGIKCSIYWKLFCPLIYDSQQCIESNTFQKQNLAFYYFIFFLKKNLKSKKSVLDFARGKLKLGWRQRVTVKNQDKSRFGELIDMLRYNLERLFSVMYCIIWFNQCSLLFFQNETKNTIFSIMNILITASF